MWEIKEFLNVNTDVKAKGKTLKKDSNRYTISFDLPDGYDIISV